MVRTTSNASVPFGRPVHSICSTARDGRSRSSCQQSGLVGMHGSAGRPSSAPIDLALGRLRRQFLATASSRRARAARTRRRNARLQSTVTTGWPSPARKPRRTRINTTVGTKLRPGQEASPSIHVYWYNCRVTRLSLTESTTRSARATQARVENMSDGLFQILASYRGCSRTLHDKRWRYTVASLKGSSPPPLMSECLHLMHSRRPFRGNIGEVRAP